MKTNAKPRAKFVITVSHSRPGFVRHKAAVQGAVRRFARPLGFRTGIISVVLLDEVRMRTIGRAHSHKEVADVLAFPYDVQGSRVFAEILLCPSQIRKNRGQYGVSGKNFSSALVFVLAHAMVHVRGYDHRNRREEQVMQHMVDLILVVS